MKFDASGTLADLNARLDLQMRNLRAENLPQFEPASLDLSAQANGSSSKEFLGFPIPSAAGLVASLTLLLIQLPMTLTSAIVGIVFSFPEARVMGRCGIGRAVFRDRILRVGATEF